MEALVSALSVSLTVAWAVSSVVAVGYWAGRTLAALPAAWSGRESSIER